MDFVESGLVSLASRPEQLDATLAALDVTIPADVKAKLDEATAHFR